MGFIISVISGKSGAGKTTAAANISACLAMLEKKTLCVDFGTGRNNIKKTLDMAESGTADHIDVLSGQSGIYDACSKHPDIKDFYVLSTSTRFSLDKLDVSYVKPMFSEIRQNFDFCVVDAPAVTDAGFKFALADADMTIIVTDCETTQITDVLIAAKNSIECGIREYRLLINRIHPDKNEQAKAAADKIFDTVGAKLIGMILEDDIISQASFSKNPLVIKRKQIFTARFLSVARGLVNDEVFSETKNASLQPAPSAPPTQPAPSAPPVPPEPPMPPVPPEPPKPPAHLMTPNIPDNEVVIPDLPAHLLGSFGDPKLWAQSTLKNADVDDLVPVFSIQQSMFVSREVIRNRMWLHDLLDDLRIPYYIEVGSRDGSKELVEAQYIYVEKKNADQAQYFIKQYNDNTNIITDDPEDDDFLISEDGIPQKICQSCSKEIDFDYTKCPHCKSPVG